MRDLTLLAIASSTPNALIVSTESCIGKLAEPIAKASQLGLPPI